MLPTTATPSPLTDPALRRVLEQILQQHRPGLFPAAQEMEGMDYPRPQPEDRPTGVEGTPDPTEITPGNQPDIYTTSPTQAPGAPSGGSPTLDPGVAPPALQMLMANHENSVTVQGPDGKWYNLNGYTKQPLAPQNPGEKPAYDSMEEAVSAARNRSNMMPSGPGAPVPPGSPSPLGPPGGPQLIPLRQHLENRQNAGRGEDPNQPATGPDVAQAGSTITPTGSVKLFGGTGVKGDPNTNVTNMQWWKGQGTRDTDADGQALKPEEDAVFRKPVEIRPPEEPADVTPTSPPKPSTTDENYVNPDGKRKDVPPGGRRVDSGEDTQRPYPRPTEEPHRPKSLAASSDDRDHPRPTITDQGKAPTQPPKSLASFRPTDDIVKMRLLKALHPNDPEVDAWLKAAEEAAGSAARPRALAGATADEMLQKAERGDAVGSSQYMNTAPPAGTETPNPGTPPTDLPYGSMRSYEPRVIGPHPGILNWWRQRLGLPLQ